MSNNFFGRRRFSTFAKKRSPSMSEDKGDNDSTSHAQIKSRIRRNRINTNNFDDDLSLPGRSHRNSLASNKSLVPENEPMPSPEEVQELFEKALQEMALPEAAKERLKMQSDEKKWEIVQSHMRMQISQPRKTNGGFAGDVKSGQYWIKKLSFKDRNGVPTFTAQDALTMASVFRTSHKDFLTEFLEGFGVRHLNKLLDFFANRSHRRKEEEEILGNIVETYRLLMNTQLGMSGVLLVKDSLRSLVMAIDHLGGNHKITEKVVVILSVACWTNEDGRIAVMDAIKYLKSRFQEISCFQNLVYLFEHTDDVAFKGTLASFFTTVSNAADSIEQRVAVRNYLFRLDIINIFEKVIAKAPEEIEEESPWRQISTQFEVFVTMMKKDQAAVVEKLVSAATADASHFDLANLHDAWKLLQKNALKADCQENLLRVVQSLFLVPTAHSLAVPIYSSIEKFAIQAASVDILKLESGEMIDFTEEPPLDFDLLGKLWKRKTEFDAKAETFENKENLVKRLRKLVGVLQKRLMDVSTGIIPPQEAMDLQEALIQNRLLKPGASAKTAPTTVAPNGAGISGAPAKTAGAPQLDLSFLAGLGLVDSGNEIEIMKEREAKLKQEVETLQKQVELLSKGVKIEPGMLKNVGSSDPNDPIASYKGKLDSTGLVPAGIAPGKTKKDPPPVPKAGTPGSLTLAPISVDKSSAPASPGPKQADGAKPAGPGNVADLFKARAGAVKAKPKGDANQEKRMAALSKLGLTDKKPIKPTVKMTQLFWNVVAPDALEGTVWPELSDQTIEYDPQELENLFGRREAQKEKKSTTKEEKQDGNEKVKLIDSQRRQNLAIALKKVNMDYRLVRQAIIEVNLEVLTVDKIQVFIDTAPTMDELTLLKKYEKDGFDTEKLEYEEQYLMEMAQIVDLLTRLNCIKLFYTFRQDAMRIFSCIDRMRKSLVELNNSKELKKILEVLLAVGNYMNGGTARGTAWGFKLDILANLNAVKDTTGNGSLIHFLYAFFEMKYPDLCNFSLPECGKAVDINFKDTTGEMNTLAKQMAMLKQAFKKKSGMKGDKLKKKLSPFEVRASKDVENLQKTLEKVKADFYALAATFAETGNDVEPCTFLPKLVTFEQDLKRAGTQMIELRENDERRKLAEEKKQERIALKKLKLLVEKTKDEDGNLDMGLIEVYKRSQTGKASQVVDRFLEKYKRDQNNKRKQKPKTRKAAQFLDA